MNVGAEPDVVGQIPADVVRVVVDHDLIAIPEPVAAIFDVVRRDTEVKSTEPEARWASAFNVPNMRPAETAGEVPVLPRTIETIMRIVAAGLVPDPFAVGVNMGDIGMAGLVGESAAGLSRRFAAWLRRTLLRRALFRRALLGLLRSRLRLSLRAGIPRGRRAVRRNPAAHFPIAILPAAALLAASLCEGWNYHQQRDH